MYSNHPTTLTFCHFAQLLVCKTRKIDKIAINEKFISQFLLPLGGKTNEFAKIAKNWNFEAVAIPAGNLAGLCPAKKYNAIAVTNNLRSKFFVMYIALPLVCKTHEFAKNAINRNFASATIPAGNLAGLCPAKKYIAISVTNNLRSKFFVHYIAINQNLAFFTCNLLKNSFKVYNNNQPNFVLGVIS